MPNFNMTGLDFNSSLAPEKRILNLENTIIEMAKRIEWLTSKLDSKNVKRLDTNETSIKSADGETVIDGPILEMYDSSDTLRLKQGYNSGTDTFLYALYNKDGDQTVGIDSDGDVTITGSLSASTITGGSISAASITGGTITSTSISAATISGGSLSGTTGTFEGSLIAQDVVITGDGSWWGTSLNLKYTHGDNDYIQFAASSDDQLAIGHSTSPGGSMGNLNDVYFASDEISRAGNILVENRTGFAQFLQCAYGMDGGAGIGWWDYNSYLGKTYFA